MKPPLNPRQLGALAAIVAALVLVIGLVNLIGRSPRQLTTHVAPFDMVATEGTLEEPSDEVPKAETGACFFKTGNAAAQCINSTEVDCKNAAKGTRYFFYAGRTCAAHLGRNDPLNKCGGKFDILTASGAGIDNACEAAKQDAKDQCINKLKKLETKVRCPAECRPIFADSRLDDGVCSKPDTNNNGQITATVNGTGLYLCETP